MKKNFQIHLRFETSLAEELKLEAIQDNISMAELIRRKIRDSPRLDRIERIIAKLEKLAYFKEKSA
jgi:hypothetical protein